MASVRDVILMGLVLFIFGTFFFIVNFVTKTMVTELVSIPIINNTEVAREAFTDLNSTVDRLDYLLFGLFIGITLGIIVSGWYVSGNPLYMFLYFLVLVIGVIFSMGLANVWYSAIAENVIFGTTISSFPITNHLMTYLPIYTAIIGMLGTVVMFAKPQVRSL